MTYLISLAVGLAIFWLLLSGLWDQGMILGLGALSIALVLFMTARIEQHSRFQPFLRLLFRLPRYWIWLLLEIIYANFTVVKSVWLPKRYPIRAAMRRLPMSQTTAIGQTIYANSITLTPGTVSISIDNHRILVHALHADSLDELAQGEMDKKVTDLEDHP